MPHSIDIEPNSGAIQDYRNDDDAVVAKSSTKFCGSSSSSSSGSIKNKIAVVVGLLLLIGSGIAAGLQINKQLTWSKATGTVVAVEGCGGGGGSNNNNNQPTYKPVIEYIPEGEGTTYKITSSTCSYPGPRVGQKIEVLYDPGNPNKAMDASFASTWLVTIVLGVLGLAFVAFPCIPGKTSGGGSNPRHHHDHHDHHYDTGGGGGGWFGGGFGGDGGGGGGDCGGGGGDCGGGGGE